MDSIPLLTFELSLLQALSAAPRLLLFQCGHQQWPGCVYLSAAPRSSDSRFAIWTGLDDTPHSTNTLQEQDIQPRHNTWLPNYNLTQIENQRIWQLTNFFYTFFCIFSLPQALPQALIQLLDKQWPNYRYSTCSHRTASHWVQPHRCPECKPRNIKRHLLWSFLWSTCFAHSIHQRCLSQC